MSDISQRLRARMSMRWTNATGESLTGELAPDSLCQEAADLIDYLEAQDGLLSKAQDEADRLRAELAEVKRPLDEQMARLNANLTAANERVAALAIDAERLDWLQFHGARVAWGNDDEVCNVVWADRDGSYYTALFNNWREAIDAAMDNRFKERL